MVGAALEAEVEGAETGANQCPGDLLGNEASIQRIGRVQLDARAASGDRIQEGKQQLVLAKEQGVVVESDAADTPARQLVELRQRRFEPAAKHGLNLGHRTVGATERAALRKPQNPGF